MGQVSNTTIAPRSRPANDGGEANPGFPQQIIRVVLRAATAHQRSLDLRKRMLQVLDHRTPRSISITRGTTDACTPDERGVPTPRLFRF